MTKQPWPLLALVPCILFGSGAAAERSVSVEPFSTLAVSRELRFPARVINLQIADIAAETSGRIVEFPVQVGDSVTAGQVLMKIDCNAARINETRIQAGLKRLRAARELTRQQLDRARRLVTSNSISREELDQRQTQLNADEASIEEQGAQLESARLEVQRCKLSAPFSGVVTRKIGQIGAYATPGAAQLTLLQKDQVEIQLDLPAGAASILNQANDIHFSDDQGRYPLRVRSMLPRIDPQSLQRRSLLNISSTEKPIGGSYGLVSFSTPRHYLPAAYIQKREGRFGVFLLRGNTAHFHALDKVQEGQPARTELAPETLVITSGLQLLNHQDPVTQQR